MKKLLLSLLVLASATMMMAQSQGAMTFVGKSNFQSFTASIDNDIDTISFVMNGMTNGDITLPSVYYADMQMTIPSFTIHNAAFTFDYSTMSATFDEQAFSETVTVDGVDKTFTGTSLSGKYDGSSKTLSLTLKYKYGNMPFESTYTVEGYYVKPYTSNISLAVAGITYEAENVTYDVRKYMDGETEKLDVKVPAYVLTGTVMGNLSLGSYTVRGLVYDEAQGGYYKDYANDGLEVYCTNGSSIEGMYALSSEGNENILVTYDDANIKIVNNFKLGNMPYTMTSTFNTGDAAGINSVNVDSDNDDNTYNIAGQRVSGNVHGIVIKNGKKYLVK